jgi:hypothetical protein
MKKMERRSRIRELKKMERKRGMRKPLEKERIIKTTQSSSSASSRGRRRRVRMWSSKAAHFYVAMGAARSMGSPRKRTFRSPQRSRSAGAMTCIRQTGGPLGRH